MKRQVQNKKFERNMAILTLLVLLTYCATDRADAQTSTTSQFDVSFDLKDQSIKVDLSAYIQPVAGVLTTIKNMTIRVMEFIKRTVIAFFRFLSNTFEKVTGMTPLEFLKLIWRGLLWFLRAVFRLIDRITPDARVPEVDM